MNGLLFIVAAPSGAGKSTLVNAAIALDRRLRLSISYTTRRPRPGEEEGRDYFFIDRPAFLAMRDAGEFLESAEVHGNLYGTARRQIEAIRAGGDDAMLEIDWQGARQVRKLFTDTVSVFILPPSLAVLEERLRGRGKDSDAVIAQRLAAAEAEISHAHEFDYAIINNDFEHARDDLIAIVRASRLLTTRQQARHPELF